MFLTGLMNLNENYGIVRRVSKDGSTIKIALPKGGSVEAQNAGFEVGDQVAFVLELPSQRVVKVLPKDVADVRVEIGQDTRLIQAFEEKPEGLPENPMEVFNHESEYEGNQEQITSWHNDICCRESGEYVIDPADYYGDPVEDGDPVWLED